MNSIFNRGIEGKTIFDIHCEYLAGIWRSLLSVHVKPFEHRIQYVYTSNELIQLPTYNAPGAKEPMHNAMQGGANIGGEIVAQPTQSSAASLARFWSASAIPTHRSGRWAHVENLISDVKEI